MKLLTRKEAADYIAAHYFPCKPATLARYASATDRVKDGPPYRKIGARVTLYDPRDLDTWAQAQIGPTMTTTHLEDPRS